MSTSVFEKMRGFLFSPAQSFRKIRDEEAGESIKYLAVLAVFYSIMSAIMTAVSLFLHPVTLFVSMPVDAVLEPLLFVTWIIVILVFTLMVAVISGLWLHIWVYILGGRKGIWQTEKSVFYNLTPFLLIGWIPMIGALIGFIWSVIIGVVGIRELHDMPDTKAAIAMVLAIVVAAFIAALLLGAMLIAVVSSITTMT